MNVLLGVVVLLAVLTAVAAFAWFTAGRAGGMHAAPRGDRDDYGPGVTPVDVAGQTLLLGGDHTAPGVVLPFTPQLGESGPEALPVFIPAPMTDEEVAAAKERFLAAVKEHKPPITMGEGAFIQVTEPANPVASGNGHADYDALMARYERLIDSRPAPVQELLHYHADSDAAVDSILHRRLTPELLARLDKAKDGGEVPRG